MFTELGSHTEWTHPTRVHWLFFVLACLSVLARAALPPLLSCSATPSVLLCHPWAFSALPYGLLLLLGAAPIPSASTAMGLGRLLNLTPDQHRLATCQPAHNDSATTPPHLPLLLKAAGRASGAPMTAPPVPCMGRRSPWRRMSLPPGDVRYCSLV